MIQDYITHGNKWDHTIYTGIGKQELEQYTRVLI